MTTPPTLEEVAREYADVIGVCGFGRCGSSLVMRMLVAGGVEPSRYSDFPDYEDYRVGKLLQGHRCATWLTDFTGQAIKLIDPQLYSLPVGPRYRFIWIDRDADEQAKSQLKFAAAFMAGSVRQDRSARKTLAASYREDRPKAMAVLTRADPYPPLVISFESLLADPRRTAEGIATHLRRPLNIEAMVRCVMPRSPKCYPGLLELSLLQNASR